jgi:hypothetical protein
MITIFRDDSLHIYYLILKHDKLLSFGKAFCPSIVLLGQLRLRVNKTIQLSGWIAEVIVLDNKEALLNNLAFQSLIRSVPDEDYYRNASCALNWISTFSYEVGLSMNYQY